MKFASTRNSVSLQCTCNKTITTLCLQAVGTCQALSAKMVLSGYEKHIIWGVEKVSGAFLSKCVIFFDVNLEISNFTDTH